MNLKQRLEKSLNRKAQYRIGNREADLFPLGDIKALVEENERLRAVLTKSRDYLLSLQCATMPLECELLPLCDEIEKALAGGEVVTK